MYDIQKIKELEDELRKLSITDFLDEIGSVQQGSRWFCPFHDETNPSFSADESRGIWHCFSCGRGGGYGKLVFEYKKMNDKSIKLYYQALEDYLKTNRFLSNKLGFDSMKDTSYNLLQANKEDVLNYVLGVKMSRDILKFDIPVKIKGEEKIEQVMQEFARLQYKII